MIIAKMSFIRAHIFKKISLRTVTLYFQGSRSYAAPAPIRRRKTNLSSEYVADGDTATSPVPRKLSPIAAPDKNADTECTTGAVNGFDQSYAFSSNKIPLPKLDRPVYAEKDGCGRITIAAM